MAPPAGQVPQVGLALWEAPLPWAMAEGSTQAAPRSQLAHLELAPPCFSAIFLPSSVQEAQTPAWAWSGHWQTGKGQERGPGRQGVQAGEEAGLPRPRPPPPTVPKERDITMTFPTMCLRQPGALPVMPSLTLALWGRNCHSMTDKESQTPPHTRGRRKLPGGWCCREEDRGVPD